LRDVAIAKARAGQLLHRDEGRAVTLAEIEASMDDLRRLTEPGIA